MQHTLQTRPLTIQESYFKKPVRILTPAALNGARISTDLPAPGTPAPPFTAPVKTLAPVDLSQPLLTGPSAAREVNTFFRNYGPFILVISMMCLVAVIYVHSTKKIKIEEEDENKSP